MIASNFDVSSAENDDTFSADDEQSDSDSSDSYAGMNTTALDHKLFELYNKNRK